MITVTATDFFNNPGQSNQKVQRDVICVTSHGRAIGYYMAADVFDAMQAELAARASYRPVVLALAETIRDLAVRHRARRIWLIGAVATGHDQAGSRVEFLADFPPDYDLLSDRMGLAQALEGLLKRRVEVLALSDASINLATDPAAIALG